jgi:hypothetical protein
MVRRIWNNCGAYIVHVAESYQEQNEKNASVSMVGAPKTLPQLVPGIAGIMKWQIEETEAAENDGRKDHGKDTCHPTCFRAHRF